MPWLCLRSLIPSRSWIAPRSGMARRLPQRPRTRSRRPKPAFNSFWRVAYIEYLNSYGLAMGLRKLTGGGLTLAVEHNGACSWLSI